MESGFKPRKFSFRISASSALILCFVLSPPLYHWKMKGYLHLHLKKLSHSFIHSANNSIDCSGTVLCFGCGYEHNKQEPAAMELLLSRRNSRKTMWLTRHRKMKPLPATAPQEKSHFRNWRSKGPLAPLMRPTKFPEIPVSLERNTEVFRHPLL